MPCTGLKDFRPGPPLGTLPSCVQAAISRSSRGVQTLADDVLIGSLCGTDLGAMCEGKPLVPFCKRPEYYNTDYCACVNSNHELAACVFPPCADRPHAYKTTVQRDQVVRGRCPTTVQFCQNTDSISGSSNSAELHSRVCSPGDDIPPDMRQLLFVLLLVLFAAAGLAAVLAGVLSSPDGAATQRAVAEPRAP